MVKFGGSQFINCSLPLAFEGRYFILESGDPSPMISVVLEHEGKPVFEILRNEPQDNPLTSVTKTPPGIVTVSDRKNPQFVYKVRPGSETSVVFGSIKGDQVTVTVTDREIIIGTARFINCVFNGFEAGVVINEDGGFGIGAPIPPRLRELFELS